MSSTNINILVCFLSIWYLLHLFLVWLLRLGLPILCWRERVRVASLSCYRFQLEGFQLFTIEYVIGCGFAVNRFYYVEIYSLYIHFGKSFFHEWMLNFIECLFCICCSGCVVLYFLDVLFHCIAHWLLGVFF